MESVPLPSLATLTSDFQYLTFGTSAIKPPGSVASHYFDAVDQEPIRLGMTLKASTVFGRRMSASQVLLPIDTHDGMVSIGSLMLHSFSDDLKARCSISGHGCKRGECAARIAPTKTGPYLS